MNIRDYKTVSDRRRALEKKLKVDLGKIGSFSLNETIASTRNCENMIGVTQVPMGVAGPLALRNLKDTKTHEYYIPLATTEGALVASVNRGCKALRESGGALVDSYRVGATRGPVFRVANLKESDRLNTFLEEHFDDLKQVAQATSTHLTLKKYMSRGVGRYRYIRFAFDTQDAMGMNMATIATTKVTQFIEKKTGVKCLSVAGNYDTDKKPSWLNVIEGRGTKAWAEVTIPGHILTATLKTTARAVYDVWLAKCMMGSIMAGAMAYNAHAANVIAAIFLATGQDLGHVTEGSLVTTTTEVLVQSNKSEGLYVSVYLPDIMVGTVGGGTGLATQHEALSLLGVAGGDHGNNAQKLAEIIAAAVLAGEVSLLVSLAQGSLARAHQALARGGI